MVFSMAIASAMGIPASFPLSFGGGGVLAFFDPLRLRCTWALKNGSPPAPAPAPAPALSAAVASCSLTGGGETQGGVPRPIRATRRLPSSGPATSRN
jgi:hypothetical protein